MVQNHHRVVNQRARFEGGVAERTKAAPCETKLAARSPQVARRVELLALRLEHVQAHVVRRALRDDALAGWRALLPAEVLCVSLASFLAFYFRVIFSRIAACNLTL